MYVHILYVSSVLRRQRELCFVSIVLLLTQSSPSHNDQRNILQRAACCSVVATKSVEPGSTVCQRPAMRAHCSADLQVCAKADAAAKQQSRCLPEQKFLPQVQAHLANSLATPGTKISWPPIRRSAKDSNAAAVWEIATCPANGRSCASCCARMLAKATCLLGKDLVSFTSMPSTIQFLKAEELNTTRAGAPEKFKTSLDAMSLVKPLPRSNVSYHPFRR